MKRCDQNFKTEALKLSDEIGVNKACEQLNVNYGTLAGWRKQQVWKRNTGKLKAWKKLLAEMHTILDEDEENKNYGASRMQVALEQRGTKRSLSTVKRAMARGNLLHEDRRSADGLTKAEKKAMRAQNIIKQDFSAQVPLRKLLTDIALTPVKGRKALCLTAFRLLQWRNHFSYDGYEHEKGTMHKNDNGGIQKF